MNIGYLYKFNSYPPSTGAGIHVYNLVTNLSQLGCTIHTFDHERNPECIVYPKTKDGIQNFLKSIDLLYVRIDGSLLSRTRLPRHCMLETGSKPIVWEVNAPAEERLFRFKTAAVSQYSLLSQRRLKLYSKWLAEILRVKLEERCRRRYGSIVSAAVCVSDQLQSYVVDELRIPKCTVVPNGADPNLFSPQKKNEVIFEDYRGFLKVIYTGDSRWAWQGFRLLTQLADYAREQGHKVLFIALDNSGGARAKSSGNLVVLNRVDYTDVPGYIASADVCLCLYEDFSWSRYGYYGSSNKLFCYMASGRPTIVSHQGQLGSVIEDGKDGLLTSNNPQDIYDKILFCLRHKEQAEQIGSAAREKVVRFYNWRRAAESTKAVFESVLH